MLTLALHPLQGGKKLLPEGSSMTQDWQVAAESFTVAAPEGRNLEDVLRHLSPSALRKQRLLARISVMMSSNLMF